LNYGAVAVAAAPQLLVCAAILAVAVVVAHILEKH
jgi:hypothetical protein